MKPSFAWAELLIAIVTVFRCYDFTLHKTYSERDIDVHGDCSLGKLSQKSPGVRVQIIKAS